MKADFIGFATETRTPSVNTALYWKAHSLDPFAKVPPAQKGDRCSDR